MTSSATPTSSVESRLTELGHELPIPRHPVANYVGCKQAGDLLYVAGQIGDIRGTVGGDVTKDDGRVCALQAALYMLGTVKGAIDDLDRIASVDKVLGFVRSAPDFTEQPYVIDGASDLLAEIFGEAGRHSRTATGVMQLPFGAFVQLQMTFRLRPKRPL